MMTHEPIDLRHLSVWERAATVLECADLLARDGSFEFYTEIDPRALMNRLEQLRPGQFSFNPRHVGDAEWHVILTRVVVDDKASSLHVAMQRSPVFSTLDESDRARVLNAATEHETKKNAVVSEENQPSESLGILLDGVLAVMMGAGARERLLYHVFPFETFREAEFFDAGYTLGRAVVLSKGARYATVPYDVLREIAQRNCAFLLALGTTTAQRNRGLASALASQVSQPILSRVASALLPYAAPERGMHPALSPLPNMTHAQVAAAAGTVKEVAARAIADLERLEALRRERGHIRYLDRTKLLQTLG